MVLGCSQAHERPVLVFERPAFAGRLQLQHNAAEQWRKKVRIMLACVHWVRDERGPQRVGAADICFAEHALGRLQCGGALHT